LPSRPERRQNWRTFLKNHREVIAAMDLFTVPTATFRTLYVLFVIGHARRDIAHWNITEHPSAQWVSQQLREAFPLDSRSRYLVFDRDTIFSAEVVRVVRSMSIEPTRTSYRSPWQNGVAERFVGTHLGLEKDAPMVRLVEPRPAGARGVHAGPRVGGLHHRYSWRAAA
jgi:transposase InsO family protein